MEDKNRLQNRTQPRSFAQSIIGQIRGTNVFKPGSTRPVDPPLHAPIEKPKLWYLPKRRGKTHDALSNPGRLSMGTHEHEAGRKYLHVCTRRGSAWFALWGARDARREEADRA